MRLNELKRVKSVLFDGVTFTRVGVAWNNGHRSQNWTSSPGSVDVHRRDAAGPAGCDNDLPVRSRTSEVTSAETVAVRRTPRDNTVMEYGPVSADSVTRNTTSIS